MKDKIHLDSEALILIAGHGNANEQLTVTEGFAEICYWPNPLFEANMHSNSRWWEVGSQSCPTKALMG